jgi:hypothetical protein
LTSDALPVPLSRSTTYSSPAGCFQPGPATVTRAPCSSGVSYGTSSTFATAAVAPVLVLLLVLSASGAAADGWG